MILLSVLLFITSCHRRRNYYISNYVATGVCAGGNIVLSIVAMIMNGIWKGEFLNVDFERWLEYYDKRQEARPDVVVQYHYSDSTVMFDLGYAVYLLVIVVSLVLILNLVWKIMLMKGEKKLLSANVLSPGGELA